MNILALECSSPNASLCLYLQNELKFSDQWVAERNHDSYLFPSLQEALTMLGGQQLDAILVGAGPGSYGGVRVAIAAASGLKIVLGTEMACIDSWGQFACDAEYMISDAKRGGWTLRHPKGEIDVKSTEEILSLQAAGVIFISTENASTLNKHGIFAKTYDLIPNATGLVKSWMQLDENRQKMLINQAPSPIYVRPPHITKAKRKPWERH